MTAEKFPHTGSKVITTLRGPSAQILKLEGIGEQAIQWAPEDRAANEIEIRARVMSTSAGLGVVPAQQPCVTWQMEIGHGMAVWHRPILPVGIVFPAPAPPPFPASLARQLYTLPMRGLFLRLSARELKFTFQCSGDYSHPQLPVATSKIQISFQPVLASYAPAYPRSQLLRLPTGLGVCEFPMEANEFRIRTLTGIPFAPGVTSIIYGAMNGGTFAGADAAACSDWTPIPTQACKYTSGFAAVEMEVQFR